MRLLFYFWVFSALVIPIAGVYIVMHFLFKYW